MFEHSQKYFRSEKTEKLEIGSMSTEASVLLNEEKVKKAVYDFVSITYPQVSKATWGGTFEISTDEKKAKTSYEVKLSEDTDRTVNVTVYKDTGEIEVE